MTRRYVLTLAVKTQGLGNAITHWEFASAFPGMVVTAVQSRFVTQNALLMASATGQIRHASATKVGLVFHATRLPATRHAMLQ